MDKKYIVRTDAALSQPMNREEAINKVKEYEHEGVEAFIVSEAEGERLKSSEFRRPKWPLGE